MLKGNTLKMVQVNEMIGDNHETASNTNLECGMVGCTGSGAGGVRRKRDPYFPQAARC